MSTRVRLLACRAPRDWSDDVLVWLTIIPPELAAAGECRAAVRRTACPQRPRVPLRVDRPLAPTRGQRDGSSGGRCRRPVRPDTTPPRLGPAFEILNCRQARPAGRSTRPVAERSAGQLTTSPTRSMQVARRGTFALGPTTEDLDSTTGRAPRHTMPPTTHSTWLCSTRTRRPNPGRPASPLRRARGAVWVRAGRVPPSTIGPAPPTFQVGGRACGRRLLSDGQPVDSPRGPRRQHSLAFPRRHSARSALRTGAAILVRSSYPVRATPPGEHNRRLRRPRGNRAAQPNALRRALPVRSVRVNGPPSQWQPKRSSARRSA